MAGPGGVEGVGEESVAAALLSESLKGRREVWGGKLPSQAWSTQTTGRSGCPGQQGRAGLRTWAWALLTQSRDGWVRRRHLAGKGRPRPSECEFVDAVDDTKAGLIQGELERRRKRKGGKNAQEAMVGKP